MTSTAIRKFDELIRCTSVLTDGIENEFSKFVSHQENSRKKWLLCEEEKHEMKKYLAKFKADNDTNQVKLNMARHQLDAEIKKRLKAEQSVDHMARQLQLIKELLLDKDSGSMLSLADKQALAQSIHQCSSISHMPKDEAKSDLPNQSYTFDESSSFLSPSDYDDTKDDILDTTYGQGLNGSRKKTNKRELPSAPPLNSEETSSEDADYAKRTKFTEEIHKTVETHVEYDTCSNPFKCVNSFTKAENLFDRSPDQNGKRPATRILKESASSTGDATIDYENYNKGNNLIARQITKQNTVPNLYPNLDEVKSCPDTRPKFNTLSSPKARNELAHSFVTKTAVRMEACGPCGKRVRFGSSVLKCKDCKVVAHTECKQSVSLPCLPSKDTPKKKEGTIEIYVGGSQDVKVPHIVLSCIEEVEKRGLRELGIYRVSGQDKDVKELKERFLRGKTVDLSKYNDIHVVCGCLKDFLRGLSEPLITFALYDSFMVAAGLTDEDSSLSAMYQCINELPQTNRDTLACLMLHLQNVAQSPDTQMTITNLAKVLGPTIVGHRSSNPSHMEMLEDTKAQPQVISRLLEMPSDYWKQFIRTPVFQVKTPPCNPNYFNGNPKTPECKPVPESLLGSVDPKKNESRYTKKTYNAMTPKVGSKDRQKFFNSPN